MVKIERAVAIANNEVAWLAWRMDEASLAGCLGFHIVREHVDATSNKVVEERPLASYVAFKGQSNPDWRPQNTTVWPVQKFTWRDLTPRKRRDRAERRPEGGRIRYRIRAVGPMKAGLEPVEVVPEEHWDAAQHAYVPNTYVGKPVPLGYLSPAKRTNIVEVTSRRGPFTSAFTNGILSTQFLLRVLQEDGAIAPGELQAHLSTPGDWLRRYLAGDVLPLIYDFFDQPGGRFHAALYELEDAELLELLITHADRLSLILSDAGSTGSGAATLYDTRNAPARAALREVASQPGSSLELQDRLFNGSGHIGHNKFVIHVDDDGLPDSVLTGSTNWTWSGIAGQSNNCIRIDDPTLALGFYDYWQRLHADQLLTPNPLSAKAAGANQSDSLKQANREPFEAAVPGGASLQAWFSPNMPGKKAPPGASAAKQGPPPDMAKLFSLMRQARRAIFFLVFLPSKGGVHSIVSEAVDLGTKDPSLTVLGAISDSQAMWVEQPTAAGATATGTPHVFNAGGVSVVRATALTDAEIGRPLGDFQFDEKLTAGKAIIHDKILVVDPMDRDRCVVAFGSHNLGYRASYANDENLVIVEGHRDLALAYTAHVLDVYDHYRFRAVQAETHATGTGHEWDGFLSKNTTWQHGTSRHIAGYFTA
jgi:phosphatidylserine/phosphatidylglycerophosphate/cardiolipin synthase-like enzyme